MPLSRAELRRGARLTARRPRVIHGFGMSDRWAIYIGSVYHSAPAELVRAE